MRISCLIFSVMNGSNGSNNGDDLEDIDPEGRAALEETRSIILLLQVCLSCFVLFYQFSFLGDQWLNLYFALFSYFLQIEMTSKEIYDVLDRTSYPVGN